MIFEPPVALASLSGRSDAAWARAAADHVGVAFLGGIAVDEPTKVAARTMVDRERNEFLPDDPISFVDDQLATLADVPLTPGFNVRAVDADALREVSSTCVSHDAIIEVNAHCRQAEMCEAGAGQSLLRDGDRLCEQVAAAGETGARVSVKVRTEVPGVDLPSLAADLDAAGADLVHVDAMDSEGVVADVVDATSCAVIANNEVRDHDSVVEYLEYGADAVSVGRASDDPRVLSRVRRAAEAWYDAAHPAAGAEP